MVTGGGDKLVIGVCYRTTSTTIFDEDLCNKLRRMIERLPSGRRVMMGDFNYGDINWETDEYDEGT